MKKIALLLAIVLLVATPLTVQAATPRFTSIFPELSFSGTTANCSVTVVGNNTSEEIDVTIKLWQGITCVRSWGAEGYGYVYWDGTATVTRGRTYKLTVDVIIDGAEMDRVYITKDCP